MQMSKDLENIYQYKSQYDEIEKVNHSLKQEIMALKRIQN